MDLPIPLEAFESAIVETIAANRLEACYVRPLVFRGYGPFGVYPLNNPVEVYIASWVWGKYLGAEAIDVIAGRIAREGEKLAATEEGEGGTPTVDLEEKIIFRAPTQLTV